MKSGIAVNENFNSKCFRVESLWFKVIEQELKLDTMEVGRIPGQFSASLSYTSWRGPASRWFGVKAYRERNQNMIENEDIQKHSIQQM